MMVEEATKDEATLLDTHGGDSADKKGSQGGKAFKKKNPKGSYRNKNSEGIPELLKGLNFCISRDGPDMYLKAIKRLGLSICTTYKTGSDSQMCLDEK